MAKEKESDDLSIPPEYWQSSPPPSLRSEGSEELLQFDEQLVDDAMRELEAIAEIIPTLRKNQSLSPLLSAASPAAVIVGSSCAPATAFSRGKDQDTKTEISASVSPEASPSFSPRQSPINRLPASPRLPTAAAVAEPRYNHSAPAATARADLPDSPEAALVGRPHRYQPAHTLTVESVLAAKAKQAAKGLKGAQHVAGNSSVVAPTSIPASENPFKKLTREEFMQKPTAYKSFP